MVDPEARQRYRTSLASIDIAVSAKVCHLVASRISKFGRQLVVSTPRTRTAACQTFDRSVSRAIPGKPISIYDQVAATKLRPLQV
jgi:hypothetical protein